MVCIVSNLDIVKIFKIYIVIVKLYMDFYNGFEMCLSIWCI